MNSVKKRFYKDVIIKGVSDFVVLITGIFTISLLTNSLGSYEYGIFVQIQATTTFMVPVLLLRLNTAFVRYFPDIIRERRKVKNILFVSALLVLILEIFFAVILLFNCQLASKIVFNSEELTGFIVFIIMLMVSSVFFVLITDFLRAIKRIKYASLMTLSQAVLVLLFVAYTNSNGYGINAFLLSYILSQIVVTLTASGLVFRFFFNGEKSKIEFSPIRPYLRYSLPLVPYSVFMWITQVSDRYFITHYLGLDKAGVYALSYNIISKAFVIYTVIAYVIYPHISGLWSKGDSAQVKYLLEKGCKIYLYFAIPITAGLTFLSSVIITLIAGQRFVVDPLLVLCICIGFIFLGMYGVYSYIVDLSEKTYIVLIILTISAAINVTLNVLLIPLWDIMGAAVATLLTYLLQVLIIYFLSGRLINVRISLDLLFIGKCVLAAALMLLILSRISIEGELSYALTSVGLGAVIYLLSTGILFRFDYKSLFRMTS